MRDHIERAFIERHPLLFNESLLNKSNENIDQSSYAGKSLFRGNQLFICGEGWLPIIDAFANALEEIIFLNQPDGAADEGIEKEEELYLKLIYGTKSGGELVLRLEHSEMDEHMAGLLDGVQMMARVLSRSVCVVCGDCTGKHDCQLCYVCFLKS